MSWQTVTATRGAYVAGVAAVLWPRFAASLGLGLIRLLLLWGDNAATGVVVEKRACGLERRGGAAPARRERAAARAGGVLIMARA